MSRRIHILGVPDALQPASQPFRYPAHNPDWGIEQDFLAYLSEHAALTNDPSAAELHYLPAFWTRWHYNHDYARNGVPELQSLVDACLIDPSRTFTVCQYADGPVVDLGTSTTLLASRKVSSGIDVPLLAAAHGRPRMRPLRRWLASFVGRLSTHEVRGEMAEAFALRRDVRVVDADKGTRRFVRTTLASRLVLCPRGYGGASFRFFEAMQLGVVPMLIGDIDTRPFPGQIDWSQCSFYARDVDEALELLSSASPATLDAMGLQAAATWRESLSWGRWCPLALNELARLT